MSAYHSALAGGRLEAARSRVHWSDESGNEAFVHDVFNPLPSQFRRCDVIWAEPPWRRGFAIFEGRAGVASPERTWKAMMTALGDNLVNLGLPTGIVAGADGAKLLPDPDRVVPVKLHGAIADLLCYRLEVTWAIKPVQSTEFVIAQLARRYQVVGDPVCGYGQTGAIFAWAGRRFVMSDFNANCIGYIAKHADSWHGT